jgi:hypothetical protein
MCKFHKYMGMDLVSFIILVRPLLVYCGFDLAHNGFGVCYWTTRTFISLCPFSFQLSSLWYCQSGQSSWLQIQRSGFGSRHYQIFWEVVGLERDPLSLISTIEELLGRKTSGCSLEIQEYGHRDLSCRPMSIRNMLALSSPTSGGRSVDIVCSRAQATEFFLVNLSVHLYMVRTLWITLGSVHIAVEFLVPSLCNYSD